MKSEEAAWTDQIFDFMFKCFKTKDLLNKRAHTLISNQPSPHPFSSLQGRRVLQTHTPYTILHILVYPARVTT